MDKQGLRLNLPPGGRDGARGTVLAHVAAVRFAVRRPRLRLSFRLRYLRSLKDNPRHSLKVLCGFRAFVIFVLHRNILQRSRPMTEQENTDQGKRNTHPEAIPPFMEAYVNQQIQDAIHRYDESQSKIKRWRNSWRSASPLTKGTFFLTAVVTVATISYAIAAWRTLTVMRTIANDSATQTQKLIDAASQMKDAGWQFKGSAQGIDGNLANAVGKLQGQVDQMKQSAKAASDSVGIAKEALQISERAYITIGSPVLEGKSPIVIQLPMLNNGHIDATGAITTLIEDTISLTEKRKIEGHWTRLHQGSAPPSGSGLALSISTTGPSVDPESIGSSKQRLFVVGYTTYSDGFPNTPLQTAPFCYMAVPSLDAKTAQFLLCDAPTMTPIIEKEIGYPNNYVESNPYQ